MTDDRSGGDPVFRSPAHRRRALLALGSVLGAVAAVTAALWWLDFGLFDPSRVRSRLAALGPAAPVAFVLLQAAQVVVAPLPGQILAGLGGYLFGARLGVVYSMTGVVLGSSAVFVASRHWGRPFVRRVIDPATRDRFDGFVDEYGTVGLFVAFLMPAFPDDALCLLAGLTAIRYRRFVVLLVVGRTPTFVLAVAAGRSFADGRLFEGAVVVGVGVLATVVVYRFRSALSARLSALSD